MITCDYAGQSMWWIKWKAYGNFVVGMDHTNITSTLEQGSLPAADLLYQICITFIDLC